MRITCSARTSMSAVPMRIVIAERMDIAALAHTHIPRITALRNRCIARHTPTRLPCALHTASAQRRQCAIHVPRASSACATGSFQRHRGPPRCRMERNAPERRMRIRWAQMGQNAGCTAAQRGTARKLAKSCAGGDALMQSARNADADAENRGEIRPDYWCTGSANFVCILCCTMSANAVYYKSSA